VLHLDNELAAGQYQIRFSFKLPDKVPSSLAVKSKSREAPKAKVKYFVKCKLNCEDSDHDMVYKQVLMIREKPVTMKEDNVIKETSEIKTWGCCS
jgi:hypothetical protein